MTEYTTQAEALRLIQRAHSHAAGEPHIKLPLECIDELAAVLRYARDNEARPDLWRPKVIEALDAWGLGAGFRESVLGLRQPPEGK